MAVHVLRKDGVQDEEDEDSTIVINPIETLHQKLMVRDNKC